MMRLRSILFSPFLIAAPCLHATPLGCDYARWGMTPAELLQAAPGQATRISPEAVPSWQETAQARADVRWKTFHLDARFLFDRQEKLVGVDLGLLEPERCYDLIQRVTAEHGQPRIDHQRSTDDIDLYSWSNDRARERLEIARKGPQENDQLLSPLPPHGTCSAGQRNADALRAAKGAGVLERQRRSAIGVPVGPLPAGRGIGHRHLEADVGGGGVEDPERVAQGARVDHLEEHLRVVQAEEPEETATRQPEAAERDRLAATRSAAPLHRGIVRGHRKAPVAGLIVETERECAGHAGNGCAAGSRGTGHRGGGAGGGGGGWPRRHRALRPRCQVRRRRRACRR